MPYKVFVAGEEALAADANTYLMSQTVPRFTNAAQRTSQLTAPVLNQLSIRDDLPGQVEYWNGTAWSRVSSGELHYSQITAAVNSTATTTGAAVTVLPGAAVSYDGAPVLVHFYSPGVMSDIVSSVVYVSLWDGSTDLGIIGNVAGTNSNPRVPFSAHLRATPTAGSHTFSIRLWVGGGTGTVQAGTGGPGAYLPAFLRVTKI